MSDYEHTDTQISAPPQAPDIPRALRFTTRQWIGLPILVALPILGLCGAFGTNECGCNTLRTKTACDS